VVEVTGTHVHLGAEAGVALHLQGLPDARLQLADGSSPWPYSFVIKTKMAVPCPEGA
jgi:hypothetical protein